MNSFLTADPNLSAAVSSPCGTEELTVTVTMDLRLTKVENYHEGKLLSTKYVWSVQNDERTVASHSAGADKECKTETAAVRQAVNKLREMFPDGPVRKREKL